MLSPPRNALFGLTTEQPAAGRRGIKAAPGRNVLAQCDRCLVSGTARIRGGHAVSINLPAHRHRHGWMHSGCGGTFVLFDIEVSE